MLVKLGQACTRMILEELHLMLQLKKENQNNLKNCIFAIAMFEKGDSEIICKHRSGKFHRQVCNNG
jgi:hypothetical protein